MMPHFTSSLCAGIFAAILGRSGIHIRVSAAPSPENADDQAIKEAIAYCKAEVKAKKIRFPASRTYLRNCVTETIRNNSAKR